MEKTNKSLTLIILFIITALLILSIGLTLFSNSSIISFYGNRNNTSDSTNNENIVKTNETINNIDWDKLLAISSLIIAVFTAIALFRELSRKKANIIIETAPTSDYVWTTDKIIYVDTICTHLYKYVRIINKSASPITIFQFTINSKNNVFYSDIVDSKFKKLIKNSEDHNFENVLTPCITLKPYEVIQGHLFFISIGGILSEDRTYLLEAKTASKDFKFKFKPDFTERDL